MKKIIPILIILFWLTMTFLLISRYAPNAGLDTEAQLVPESKQRWMGIYLKGQKIGFTSSRFEKEIDGYAAYEEIKMKIMVLGIVQDIHSRTSVLLSPALKVRSFKFTLNAAQNIEVDGNIRDKTLILDITTANNKSRREIMLDEAPQMTLTIIPYLLQKGLKSGMKIRLPVFDPVTFSTQKMLIEIVGKEKINLNNSEIDAFKIKGDLNGLKLLMWIDKQGNELKEESPMGFTLIAEPMEKAMKIPDIHSQVPDIITQTSVPFNLELPPDVSYLKVRLKGIDFGGLELNGGRQTLKEDVLEIVKEDINATQHVMLPILKMEQFLADSPFAQSKNPEIVNLANTIIGNEKNALTAGRLLWAWVFKNIEKTPSITIPSAVDIFKTRKGDCNEHTVLYTALARAAGLPTKINVGLVYKDKRFYYHAWPEIFAGRWIAIDPTLGQFPADASHIRLISGDLDKQMILLKVINNISLEGTEYR
ncbi:MAG: transglutaminase-like domain-containing protein [Nitrospirota bacterium]|mgnify:FL=1